MYRFNWFKSFIWINAMKGILNSFDHYMTVEIDSDYYKESLSISYYILEGE